MASLREKIRRNAASLLKPGEEVQAVVPAQWSKPGPHSAGGRHATLVATDQRILLCDSGWFRASPVRSLITELPRETAIGPAHGLSWYEFVLPIKTPLPGFAFSIWINRRFFKDVAAADAARKTEEATW